MKHNKYESGGNIDAFNFDNKMALINLNMIYEYAIKLDKLVSEDTELEEWVKMKLTRIEQNVSDVKHSLEGWEKYNQGGMIFKKQLLTISNYSKSLIDMIQGGSQLMSWQESKLAICANDIDGIYHHLDYKMGNRASETFELGGNIGKGSEIVFFDKYYDKKRTGTIISEVGKNEYEVGTAIGTKLVSKDEIIGLAEKVEDDSWFSNGGEIENLVDKKEIEIQEYDKDTFIEFRVPSKIYNEIDAYVKVFFEYEEIEVSYLQYDEFIDVKEDAYIAYDYEVEFLTDSPTEITDEMKQQLNEEAKKVYDSYFHKYSYDGLFDIFANYGKYKKPENKLKPHKYEHLKKYQTGNWRDLKFTKSELEQLGIKPKLSNGGNIDYDPRWSEMEAYSPYEKRGEYLAEQEFEQEDLRENSRKFYESAEESVRKNLENGEICMCKLRKILGREPDYPRQVVGSLVLTKSFLRSFYKL